MKKILFGLLFFISISSVAQVKISQMPTIVGNDTDSLWLPSLQSGVNKKVRGWQLKPLVTTPTWQQTLNAINGNILTQDNEIDAGGYDLGISNSSRFYIDADSAVFFPTILDADSSRQLATTKWVKKNMYTGLITASNGLTKTANDIKLGGTLSANTTINTGSNFLNITGDGGIGLLSNENDIDLTGQNVNINSNLQVISTAQFSDEVYSVKKIDYNSKIHNTYTPRSLPDVEWVDSLKLVALDYADTKVEDAIVDGVTTKAPSQNAVFDALALKQNSLGFTPENVANKENVTIDNNTTKYPTVNLLKTGLDTKLNIVDLPVITASNGLTKNVNNFELGGTITKPTTISTTGYNFDIRDTTEYGKQRFVLDTDGNVVISAKTAALDTDSAQLRVSSEDQEAMMQVTYSGKTNRVFVNPGGAEIDAFDPINGGVGLFFSTTGAQFVDTRAVKKGLEYGADYSADLVPLSLTPKVYVDKKAANILTNTTDVGNIGVGEDDLMTYSIPAGKLANNGDYLEFTMTFVFAANANNKEVKIYYGATNLYSSTAQPQNTGSMEIKGTIIRTSATTQSITLSQNNNTTNFVDYADYKTANETMANAITLKATGAGTSNNDIIQKILLVKYFPGN